MRRQASIAAFALVLTVPVWAQHGGHAGGGHGGGFVSHGAGHVGGGRSFSPPRSSGMRSAPASSHGFNRSFNRNFTSNVPLRNRGFRDRGFHNRGFRNNCLGFGCRNWAWGWGSPWWGWNYYDPGLWSTWDDEDRRFDQDYYGQYEMADEWNRQNIEEQRMMRQEEEDGDQDAYAPRYSPRHSSAVSESQPEPMLPPTVLVYRDQHKEEVSNYAIVGQTLWSFSAQRTKKIPLSDLDLPATEKANDDRGLTFNVPAANSGQ